MIKASAIASHSTATSNDSWDKEKNVKHLKSGESKDYYRKEYAWEDSDKDGTHKGDFKFPHHEVSADGDIGAANVEACRAGIEVLNGARGGTKIPSADKKGVYDHLAKHMKDAGVDAPEYKGMAARSAPAIRASLQDDGTCELTMYGEIVDSTTHEMYKAYGIDAGFISGASVKKALDDAGDYDKIRVRINSPGGDAFEGLAIHSYLRGQKKPIETCIDGIAASSASIVAMAGDTITMGNSSMMMIHNAWSVAVGYASDMRKMADTLDKVSEAIGQTYIDKSGMTADKVKSMMDAETWLSAKDCVENGLATQIAGQEEEDPKAMARARTFKALARMRNVPVQLKAKDADKCDCPCDPCSVDGDCENCSNAACDSANCTDCPMQAAGGAEDSNLSQYEARLALMKLNQQ